MGSNNTITIAGVEVDLFTAAYIDAALWATVHPTSGVALDDLIDRDDLPADVVRDIAQDCADFQEECAAELALVGDDERNGHDFFLTRDGHGAGFWDRGYGDVGARLTSAAKAFGSGSDILYSLPIDIDNEN